MQTQAHQAFVNDYAFLKKASTAEGAYMCSYAPMMIVELTTSQIETLAKDSDVNTMYYSPDRKPELAMNISLPLTNAKYVRDTGNFSGTGIKIGMVELGIPDISTDSLINSNITTNPETLAEHAVVYQEDEDYTVSVAHATAVADIIVSTSSTAIYAGIVPEAELYCAAIDSVRGGFFAAVDWLLEQNVTVINMSAGWSYDYGQYNEYDRWADHIAHNHSVHFVVAAGNRRNDNTNLRVCHPALAYNVITVGAIDDGNTVEVSDDVIASYSCYNEVSYVDPETGDIITAPNKPDVVAPRYFDKYRFISVGNTLYR